MSHIDINKSHVDRINSHVDINILHVKGIGSILFLKNGLKKKIVNVLDAMILENINLSEDKIGRPPLRSNETELDLLIYAVSSVYFNHTLISYVHWT
jgi:hypothetical protein